MALTREGDTLGVAVAGKSSLLDPNSAGDIKIVQTSRFGVIFILFQNCRQTTATPHKCISHADKSSQMPYTAIIKKITNLRDQIEKSLRAPPS